MIIGIDFDGTCVTHDYPRVGFDVGAAPVLRKLVKNGHQLMLWTMRGNNRQDTLQDAIDWFKKNDIPLWGINENPDQKASGWTNSHKQHAELYIDDVALGAPLKMDRKLSVRPFVDWDVVEQMLVQRGIISVG